MVLMENPCQKKSRRLGLLIKACLDPKLVISRGFTWDPHFWMFLFSYYPLKTLNDLKGENLLGTRDFPQHPERRGVGNHRFCGAFSSQKIRTPVNGRTEGDRFFRNAVLKVDGATPKRWLSKEL